MVPSFLQLVAGRSGTWVTLGDLQKAVQSHKLTFPNTLLEPMFVEADFRNSGRLSAQELVAALSGGDGSRQQATLNMFGPVRPRKPVM